MNKVFRSIGHFIDKKIILPITKFFVFISSKLKGNGRGFEILITRKQGLIFISLLIAVGLFFVTDSKSTSLVETSAEVLYNQPIIATYNEEAYVVEGLPKTVDVTLIGRRSDVYLAKQMPLTDITVDLSGLKPGVHKVDLKYKKALSSVDYRLDPSAATIVIYQKVSVQKELNYEVINKDKVDSKLIVDNVSLNTDSVYVKGTESKINNVASVKALIDLNQLTEEDKTAGKHTLTKVKLVAYDEYGKTVNVEMVPSTVTATIDISSPQKEVPLTVIPKNYENIVFGKAISTITTDVSKVTIYGKQSALDKISYIPIYVDVSGLKEDKTYSMTIKKPTGVRAISNTSVNVSVALGEQTTKQINDVYIETENLDDGLSAQAIDANSTKVSVSVQGVKSVLDELDPTTIKAYVDLKKVTAPGEYTVKVKVTGSDKKIIYRSMTEKITLKVTKKQ